MCVSIWQNIRIFITKKLNVPNANEIITMKTVMLGICSNIEHKTSINFIILYAKYFIWIKKMNESKILSFKELEKRLRSQLYLNMTVAKNMKNYTFIRDVTTLSLALNVQ